MRLQSGHCDSLQWCGDGRQLIGRWMVTWMCNQVTWSLAARQCMEKDGQSNVNSYFVLCIITLRWSSHFALRTTMPWSCTPVGRGGVTPCIFNPGFLTSDSRTALCPVDRPRSRYAPEMQIKAAAPAWNRTPVVQAVTCDCNKVWLVMYLFVKVKWGHSLPVLAHPIAESQHPLLPTCVPQSAVLRVGDDTPETCDNVCIYKYATHGRGDMCLQT